MAFTIPDNDEATSTNQALWMQTDINALVAGIGGDGVVSGCAVTAQGTPDMTVAVAAGTVRLAGVYVAVAAGNVTITTANATNPRIDLIVVNSSGTKSATAGTAAANPKAPDIPASSVLLAMVYVPANQTSITSGLITDKRAIVPLLPMAAARAKAGGTTHYSVPGVNITSTITDVPAVNTVRYMPFLVNGATLTLDQMAISVQIAAASSFVRVGIYAADTDWQPTTLVVDGGALDTSTTGQKTASISTTLPPGRYLMAMNATVGTPTLRGFRGGHALIGYNATLSNFSFWSITGSQTYGAFPSTGTAWSTIVTGDTGLVYLCYLRISAFS